MQVAPANFTAEARETARKPAASLQVAWKKGLDPNLVIFTIGVSTIGGNDIIGGEAGVQNAWTRYQYFDESDYLMSLAYEQGLNIPGGGLTKGLFDLTLDNTSGRFLPDYMGGNGEMFTAILPRRPVIINAGFNYNGVDNLLPQFVGINTKQPEVDTRRKTVSLSGADFLDFLQNKYIDNTAMFTGVRSDELMETVLSDLGYTTAEYELDAGINILKFALLQKGDRIAEVLGKIAQAEYGHIYQDKEGVVRFENRQHWDSPPHDTVQAIITTGMVLEASRRGDEKIINVVEISSEVRNKQSQQVVFQLNQFDSIKLDANTTTEQFVDFEDPILELIAPTPSGDQSYYMANSEPNGSGTDLTASVSITKIDQFAQAAKLTIQNSSDQAAYITELVIAGRPAKVEREIYIRARDDSSATAYEERPYKIENHFIQSEDWAKSFAQMVLNDFAEPENTIELQVIAQPHLELGDLISWQGNYWRIYNMQTIFDPSAGFLQNLKLLQRDIVTYFRVGISSIGGTDRIAP